MAVVRFEISLAIPKEVYDTIPLAKKTAARDAIRGLKALAVKINEGQSNEEMTVRAIWRVCYHDEGEGHPPCEPEQEI